MQIAADPDLTLAEKARILGRTHYGVTGMIAKLHAGEVRLP